jgi:hypothetical protein
MLKIFQKWQYVDKNSREKSSKPTNKDKNGFPIGKSDVERIAIYMWFISILWKGIACRSRFIKVNI